MNNTIRPDLNRPETKDRYLTHYWGQLVFKMEGESFTNYVLERTFEADDRTYGFLELTSLANITDEDAIAICRIAAPMSFLNEKLVWVVDIDTEYGFKTISAKGSYHSFDFCTETGKLSMYDGDNPSGIPINHYGVLDALRANSYATDWMGYTIEELIAAGYCQLRKEGGENE